jgi:hypothetical protein
MPPIENELAESDFNDAVNAHLYLFESRRETARMKSLARGVGYEVARILAPLWGGEVKSEDYSWLERAGCDHEFGERGACVFCGLVVEGGVMRYGDAPVECDGHVIVNGECRKCGGQEIADGLVTKGSPRVIGASIV